MLSRFWKSCICIWALSLAGVVSAQEPSNDQIENGSLELSTNNIPDGWRFVAPGGGATIDLDLEDPLEGRQSAVINSLESNRSNQQMTANLMQVVDATPWRGKRVRFRAAVRTKDLQPNAGAQLWFRVDRPKIDGKTALGAFDNMQDRPIRSNSWRHYEIVLQVDDDAKQMVLGMFLLGKGVAWLDDVSLEEVDKNTPTTGRSEGTARTIPRSAGEQSKKSKSKSAKSVPSRTFQMPAAVVEAFAKAEDAPQQPFFSHWMWLALVAVTLFVLSGLPPRTSEIRDLGGQIVQESTLGFIPKFAIRFSVAYWLLYCLPQPLMRITSQLGSTVSSWSLAITAWYNQQSKNLVTWIAENIFNVSQLVPPNGSGDTSYNYIQVFTIFILALAVAILWSAADWRKTDYRHVKDLLRSYLRYVLAITMLSYGLAKLGWDSNQFPTLGEYQLDRTWGESSPMGVLWSFMGASRAYTFFAGLGEVIGGTLLLFRRTTLLGAMVVLGVMTNVMMLNFCYDVPVKLYSTHLVFMALYLLLPDTGRLVNLLFLHRRIGSSNLRAPYDSQVMIWVHWSLKAILIVLIFCIPLYKHIERQINYFSEQANLPNYIGSFDVVEFKLDGPEDNRATTGSPTWKTVKLERRAYNRERARVPTYWIFVGLESGNATTTFEESQGGFFIDEHQFSFIPSGQVMLTETEPGCYLMKGQLPAGEFKATLKPQSKSRHRLTSRGFRWINEVPFNK